MVIEERPEDVGISADRIAPFIIEQKREALDVGFPQERLKDRLPLITNVTGRPPNLYLTCQVRAESEIQDAIIEDRDIHWKDIELPYYVLAYAPSIGRKGRIELVEIARLAVADNRPRSLVERILGR